MADLLDDLGDVVSRDVLSSTSKPSAASSSSKSNKKQEHQQHPVNKQEHKKSIPTSTDEKQVETKLPSDANSSKQASASKRKHHDTESTSSQSNKRPRALSASHPNRQKVFPAKRSHSHYQLRKDRCNLPIYRSRDELIAMVENNDAIVLVGETGCGKTTQIPQYLLDAGFGKDGIIGCTQPRRVAAISVAQRVAQEFGCKVGEYVGYSIRFEDATSKKTKIKYITDGMLLRETLLDPLLLSYSVIILDEAHERTVNTDILFALLKDIQRKRKEMSRLWNEKNGANKHNSNSQTVSGSDEKKPADSATKLAELSKAIEAAASMTVMDDYPPFQWSAPFSLTPWTKKQLKDMQRAAKDKYESDKKEYLATKQELLNKQLKELKRQEKMIKQQNSTMLATSQEIVVPDVFIAPLKLIIMSATLESSLFSSYFYNCPITHISGRTYPVEIFYADKPQDDYLDATVNSTLQIHQQYPLDGSNDRDEKDDTKDTDNADEDEPSLNVEEGEGEVVDAEVSTPGAKQSSSDSTPDSNNFLGSDILVFLTGQEEIETCQKILEDKRRSLPPDVSDYLVRPIYAALPSELQLLVFQQAPPNTRKIILATNIAETSITISGVKFVVDSGLTKVRQYNPRTGLESLRVIEISKAEAWQRSGRAGRQQNGYAYRLYTEQSFLQMRESIIPEILRTNLSSVILVLKSLHVKNILSFDFITKPSVDHLKHALEQLWLLGALKIEDGSLSDVGKLMVQFPLVPSYAKTLIMATKEPFDCAEEVLSILAMLTVDSLFYNGKEKKSSMNMSARKLCASPLGDHFTLLEIFNTYNKVKENERQGWCFDHYVNSRGMLKVLQVRSQLAALLESLHLPINSCYSEYERVQKCLITGFFLHTAKKQEDGTYVTLVDSQVAQIHPSSTILFSKKPQCLLYNELVSTSKIYLRDVIAIEQNWLAEIVPQFYTPAGLKQPAKLSSNVKERLSNLSENKTVGNNNTSDNATSNTASAEKVAATQQSGPSTPSAVITKAVSSSSSSATPAVASSAKSSSVEEFQPTVRKPSKASFGLVQVNHMQQKKPNHNNNRHHHQQSQKHRK